MPPSRYTSGMPQPYLPTFSSKRYIVGFEAIKDRPALAAAIGRCIGIWSYVDNELQGLFGVLLGVDSAAAHGVFVALRRWSQQRDALEAAAKGRGLSSDEATVYSALLAEYGALEAQRNKYLCHGCFGVCPDDEDLLFVINVGHHVLWQADTLPKHLKGSIPADSHEALKKHMYVYRMSDLETLLSQMEQLWWDMFYFNGYLRAPHDAGRVAKFRKLVESPRIQQRAASGKTASQKG